MIRRVAGTGWELVRQPDHGLLAGAILDRLAVAPRGGADALRLAVRRHDDGWLERDARVRPGPDGGPETFLDLPLEEHLAISERTVALVRADDRYAGAIVAWHVAWLHGLRPLADERLVTARDAAVDRWRRDALEAARAAGLGEDDLEHDQRLCALADFASLWLCGWPDDAELDLARGRGPAVPARLDGDRCLLPAAILAEPDRVEVPVALVGPGPGFEERDRSVRAIALERAA
jgi:hypothetical protein